jgi:hypothetical protein
MRIIYVPLEPYEERYTLQLLDWNEREFRRLGIEFLTVKGVSLDISGKIKTGDVLDVHQRCYWALSQIASLTAYLRSNELNSNDFIFFEDMFHPGIEALAYIFHSNSAVTQ